MRTILTAMILLGATHCVLAQSYPSKIIKVVIPWPGGSNDAAGRIVFQRVAEAVGQPVVIENRAGASGQTRAVNRDPLAGCERP